MTVLAVIHTRDIRAALTTNDGTVMHAAEYPFEATLNAITALVDHLADAPATVYVSDGTIRRELIAVAASFPHIVFVSTPRGRLLTLLEQAADTLDEMQRPGIPEPAPETPRQEADRLNAAPTLTVATDASKGNRNGVGYASITETGHAHRAYHPKINTILVGELLAIKLALESHPHRNLRILTDSKAAISAIVHETKLSSHHSKGVETVLAIRRLMEGREVRLEWVHGHRGHTLNETAHRLAVASRRLFEAQVDKEVGRKIFANITAPLREAIAA